MYKENYIIPYLRGALWKDLLISPSQNYDGLTMRYTDKDIPYIRLTQFMNALGEYFRGYKMSEREADALLRKDLRKFCALYRDLGKDSILLGTLAYNIGPGAVNKSSVYKMLKSGNRNIFKAYTIDLFRLYFN